MEMKQIHDAVQKLNEAFTEYKTANDDRLKQIEEKGAADPLLEQKLEAIQAEMDKQQKVVDDFELSMKRQSVVVKDQYGNVVDMDQKYADWATMALKRRGKFLPEGGFGMEQMNEYKAAFDKMIRQGEQALSADELKALSVGTDPDGGYLVNPDMSGRIVKKVFETSAMRAYASIQVISTGELKGLHDDDEASAGWVGETATRSETGTPQIKEWSIPVHELYAKPKATQTLLDDAEVNMEEWLAGKVSSKFTRMENNAFCVGNGVVKPRGFLDYADGTATGQIERFQTGVNGGFAAAPNGGDALIDALYGLKSDYRNNATWFMNRTTTKTVRKLKDSDGAYLWSPGIAAGQPATLLGYPTASFEDMPNPATGSLSIAVGDMREAYQIVDRQGMRTLRDPYSAKPYVEFYTTKRTGGDVVNFEALKLVEFKA